MIKKGIDDGNDYSRGTGMRSRCARRDTAWVTWTIVLLEYMVK